MALGMGHNRNVCPLTGSQHSSWHAIVLYVTGFEEADVVPEMFVMMGNFCSRSCSGTPNADYLALKDGFSSLAQLIEQYPKIKVG